MPRSALKTDTRATVVRSTLVCAILDQKALLDALSPVVGQAGYDSETIVERARAAVAHFQPVR